MRNKLRIFFVAALIFCCVNLFAQKISGKLTGANIKQYELQDSSIQAYKTSREFAYIKYLDSLLKHTPKITADTFAYNSGSAVRRSNTRERSTPLAVSSNNVFNNLIVKVILWVLAIAFIAFILYKFFFSDILFRRNTASRNFVPTKNEEEISDPDAYEKLIADAATNKDFRLAVRYLYLQTLKVLSGKGLIAFSADKTNYQYQRELANTAYQKDFTAITLHYEYTWYGKFDISEDVYKNLLIQFKNFQQKI